MLITPVILSGGSGTRLWPLSRNQYSKQFLPLLGERTMLQQTVDRLRLLPDLAPPIFVCNKSHRFLVAEQVHDCEIGPAQIILEPVPRNTAPAVAIAALEASAASEDPFLLVLPADHHIQDTEAVCQAIELACQGAAAGVLMTFGIVPPRPETSYAYIAMGEPLKQELHGGDMSVMDGLYEVIRFVEKPDRDTARQYMDAGNYLWNSGMFLFRASRYLEELQRYTPEIFAACQQSHEQAVREKDFIRLPDTFAASPEDSIDYAVMERTQSAGVVPPNSGWSDVGSWDDIVRFEDNYGRVAAK